MARQFLKIVLSLFFLQLVFTTDVRAFDAIKLSDELIVRKIAPDAFMVTHYFPWPCNSLLCRLDSVNYVLVDTPYENQATQALVEWIMKQHDRVNLQVINSHFHRDNLGGNEYLLNRGIPVYGADMTARILAEKIKDPNWDSIGSYYRQPQYQRYRDLVAASQLMPPDHLYKIDDGLVIADENDTLEVWYPGAGHSPDNVVVYWHNRQILFGGCIVKSLDSVNLGNLEDAVVEDWPASVQRIQDKFPNSQIVIPGHGEYGDLRLLQHTMKLLKNYNQ